MGHYIPWKLGRLARGTGQPTNIQVVGGIHLLQLANPRGENLLSKLMESFQVWPDDFSKEFFRVFHIN